MHHLPTRFKVSTLLLASLWTIQSPLAAQAIPAGEPGHRSHVKVFFDNYCIKCHGPEKSKGKITLHTLDGDLATGAGGEMERWEKILEVMDLEEMPPEDEKQPTAAEREAVKAWIDQGMRDHVAKAADAKPAPLARRLTNFEYQNTMRDLLGMDLELIKDLPQDPEKPYHFNNTAEFMLLGPEKLDRYLKAARRALASAIVDPAKPEVHRQSWSFEPKGPAFAAMQPDETRRFHRNEGHGRQLVARDRRIPHPRQGRCHPAAGLSGSPAAHRHGQRPEERFGHGRLHSGRDGASEKRRREPAGLRVPRAHRESPDPGGTGEQKRPGTAHPPHLSAEPFRQRPSQRPLQELFRQVMAAFSAEGGGALGRVRGARHRCLASGAPHPHPAGIVAAFRRSR